ncbi:MAG: hypothetical protein MUF45_02830 [Spirosomaceae bacterium]|nr:hypothetical protein [Spirosomataceae bacterium]
MKVTLTAFLTILSLGKSLFAQKNEVVNEKYQDEPISIFGNFIFQGIYPGFRIGVEQPLKQINYLDSFGKLKKHKDRAVQYSLGFYYHGGFHTNFFATSEYVFRRVNKNGGFREFRPGLSLSRTFLGASTYEVGTNGDVSKINGAGDFYFMPSLNFGVGKDYGLKNPSLPLNFSANLNLAGLLPYNGLVLPTPMLEIGFRYKFKNAFKTSLKVIDKQTKNK